MGAKNDISGGYGLMGREIKITVNEDNSIQVKYPNDLSLMETVGVLEGSKAILLNQYMNPKGNKQQ